MLQKFYGNQERYSKGKWFEHKCVKELYLVKRNEYKFQKLRYFWQKAR
jgi:hypothetical protein